MPKDTFLKLSKEKQKKVIDSAKQEFARVPIEEVSIKNIVEQAGIARGSFYQYFESKEDLLIYILRENVENISQKLKEEIIESKGNLFDIYVNLYDLAIENFVENDEQKLFKQIFENIRTSDENIFQIVRKSKPKKIHEYYELIDTTNLKIENNEDLELICEILNGVVQKAVVKSFKKENKEQAKKEFLRQMEFLKNGIIKKEEKDV